MVHMMVLYGSDIDINLRDDEMIYYIIYGHKSYESYMSYESYGMNQ